MDEILLVEDDENLGISLEKYLTDEGYRVKLCKTLKDAREENLKDFKIIILDWMLPDGQGLDYLKELRLGGNHLPVLMLTARTELIDKVIGLESGANDYLTKPFEPRELIARIRVQLRGNYKQELSDTIVAGDLSVNKEKREVYYLGEKLELTKLEYELLVILAETPGRPFTREELLNKIWGYDTYPSTRTVDTHILQLRQKTSDEYFETIRGIGYRFKEF
ncbi:MAG: response regulator transcription factor [Deltaproteobacteria bacterium]|nr:MAG: response regulator transcription factor [Deltaproteobacteria bacterium]